jgi:hypothetical protein
MIMILLIIPQQEEISCQTLRLGAKYSLVARWE